MTIYPSQSLQGFFGYGYFQFKAPKAILTSWCWLLAVIHTTHSETQTVEPDTQIELPRDDTSVENPSLKYKSEIMMVALTIYRNSDCNETIQHRPHSTKSHSQL